MLLHSWPCSLDNGNERMQEQEEKNENPHQSAKEGMRETEAGEEERACGRRLPSACLGEEGGKRVGMDSTGCPRPCPSFGATSCPPDSLQPPQWQSSAPGVRMMSV